MPSLVPGRSWRCAAVVALLVASGCGGDDSPPAAWQPNVSALIRAVGTDPEPVPGFLARALSTEDCDPDTTTQGMALFLDSTDDDTWLDDDAVSPLFPLTLTYLHCGPQVLDAVADDEPRLKAVVQRAKADGDGHIRSAGREDLETLVGFIESLESEVATLSRQVDKLERKARRPAPGPTTTTTTTAPGPVMIAAFDGNSDSETPNFTVSDDWEIRYTLHGRLSSGCLVVPLNLAGQSVATGLSISLDQQSGTSFLRRGGDLHLQVSCFGPSGWRMEIWDV